MQIHHDEKMIQGAAGLPERGTVRLDGSRGFGEMLEASIDRVNQEILRAQGLSELQASGGAVELADTVIALSKADLSFRLALQVRNKALGAYEEIMRMQF